MISRFRCGLTSPIQSPPTTSGARLSQQIDLRHPLVRLAGLTGWQVFEARFGKLYHPQLGRPSVPIRLMVGLCYLQHTFQLSDQEVVERWVENPYWQVLCGFDHMQLKLPIDPSSLVRWRQRIGQDGIELLLQETIATATRGQAGQARSSMSVPPDTVEALALHPRDQLDPFGPHLLTPILGASLAQDGAHPAGTLAGVNVGSGERLPAGRAREGIRR